MKYACALAVLTAFLWYPWIAAAADGADIHAAARAGDLARVVELLTASPELVNARTGADETPLHYAVLGRQRAVVELLLAWGADANAADWNGQSPLHVAAQASDSELAASLLLAGADVNAPDHNGQTPLHIAARRFRLEVAQRLIAGGAEINARDVDGQTPLHVLGADAREVAPEFEKLLDEIAQVLIDAGADPTLRDQNGAAAWPHEPVPPAPLQPSGYPAYATIVATLQNYASQYPSICQLFDLGLTVQNRHIYALKITDNPSAEEDEPEFKYVANMHGDEVTGVIMCLDLIDYLLTHYGSVPRVDNLVNNIEIWIVPTMNPDGYTLNTRENASGADLNRSFPEGSGSSPDPNTTNGRPIEVADIMNWAFAHSFTLAANFHGGALVVNYAFDNDGLPSGTYSPTPDDDLFVAISEEYSEDNSPMWNSGSFYHGITNGAEWYVIDGGMQDWDYRYEGCNEVTIELGTKAPAYSQMPTYWSQNQESMLSYMETCLTGVRGLVTDATIDAPLAATVTVAGRNHYVYTDPNVGDYHRMLLPGTYTLTFRVTGYDPLTFSNVAVSSGAATRLDVQMGAPPHVTYPNGGETLYSNQHATVTWTGGPSAQFHVQSTSNYGTSATVNEGFEGGALPPGYSTGGIHPWYITTGTVHAGQYSVRAGTIANSQQSWMESTALGGSLSFYYKVSSESSADFFNFYVDGTRRVHTAGNVNWVRYSTTLTAGPHLLRWEYAKDSSGSSGSDTVWVDDVSLVADQTVWTDIIDVTDPGATSVQWTPTQVGTANKVRVQALYGPDGHGAWDESDAVFTVVEGPAYQVGDMNCDGNVDNFDITPFVLALTDAAAYVEQYANCDIRLGDINGDGNTDNFDISPFVMLLSNP